MVKQEDKVIMKKTIEIPFGAKDSELKGWEYTIPEGMEAEIKDGKIIVREKESEDERIIERIKMAAESYWSDEPLDEILAWLEKQGSHNLANSEKPCKVEQNLAWSEEDEYCLDGAIETEMYMLDVVNGVKKFDVGNKGIKEECTKELKWLKSLKERYTWKPSDEQMEAVRIAAEIGTANNSWAMDVLKSMHQDLKKLKG